MNAKQFLGLLPRRAIQHVSRHKLKVMIASVAVILAGLVSRFNSRPEAQQGVGQAPPAIEQGTGSAIDSDDIAIKAKAAYEILNPKEHTAQVRALKTPQQLQEMDFSAWSITNPLAHATEMEKLKTPEQKQRDTAVREAFLNADGHSRMPLSTR